MTNFPSKEMLLSVDLDEVFQTPFLVDWGRRDFNATPSHSIAGDCFLLPYKNHGGSRYDYILVDSGLAETYKNNQIQTILKALNYINPGGVITGIILTHTDTDHIEGLAVVANAKISVNKSIYAHVKWIVVGMTYAARVKPTIVWKTLAESLVEVGPESWNMERVLVPTTQPTPPGQEPQPTPEECKEHMDTISRRIFCNTNGQVLVRNWNLLNNNAKVTDEIPPFNESMYYYEKRDRSLISSEKSTQNMTQNMDIITSPLKESNDSSRTNLSSISTVYYSYEGSRGISHYYCFNGDSLFSLSHLFTIGLPHNQEFAKGLYEDIIDYPYNIPEEMGEEDIGKLARVYDKVFTIDIHYKFQSMIEVVEADGGIPIDAMNKALVPQSKRILVYIYLLRFKKAYASLGWAINKWDGFQLPHHGSFRNSLGIDNFSIFPIGSTTSNPSNKLVSRIDSTKLATTYQHVSSLFFVTSAGTNNHMAQEYIGAFQDLRFLGSKVLVPYPSVIQKDGEVEDEDNLFSNNPMRPFFTLGRLYMYIFWNFAPIFPASLIPQYNQLAQLDRGAYGIYSGHQLINLPDLGETADKQYDANLKDLQDQMELVSKCTCISLWDILTKFILTESGTPKKVYLLPEKPIEIKAMKRNTQQSLVESLEETSLPDDVVRNRGYLLSQPPTILTNMMLTACHVSDLVPIADWLHNMWVEVDKIELSTHNPDLFEASGEFQFIGKTIISDERFFPIILDGLSFSFDVNTSHDQLFTVVHTTGLIEHPTSYMDSTPTTTLVTVDLLRTKTAYSDYTPTYELNITLENDNIINILPTSQSDGKKKNLKVLSNEIKYIDKQFSTYDDNPSTIKYTLSYDKNYSLDELTKLSKVVTPELKSLKFYVEDTTMTDGIIITLQDQNDEELESSNVDMLYVRNFVISGEEGGEEEDEEKEGGKGSIDKYIIKLSFFVDSDASNNDKNIDVQHFIRGSFSLHHIISNGKKKPILFSDLCRDIIFSGHNNFILDDFLLDIFAKYPFLYSSFNNKLDSLLSMLSIRQLSGSFFGSITELTTIQSLFSAIQFSSFESIVQFTPPKELHIFQDIKLPLQNINFYFQLEYDYESKFEINSSLFDFEVKYHSLKLEGEFVIQSSDTSTYKINVLYSFGSISSLEVKKSRFIQDNLTTNMNLSGFKDAFGIEDGLIPPISFFDNLMGYLPDYLRITLYEDYSFGGIEAKFMKADLSFSLTKQIEVSKFTLALEYFPNLNTDVFAIAEFHKVSTDENNSSRELLGTLSFNYEYKNKQGSIEASLQLNSNTSVYQIIELFVDKFNVEDFPASLETFSLREISVRFNLTTKVLEKFHIRIDSKISLSFIAEYLTLARLDITYLSSRLFHFEGLLESKSTSYLVTIRRISFSDQGTCWRLEGISTQKVTTIANFTDIYTKLKSSTTAEEFVNVILEEIHVNEISLDIEKYTEAGSDIKKTRILFYAEINSLKLAFIYDNGSVNVLSTLKFLIQKDPVSLNTASSISNLTHPLRRFPQLSIQNKNGMSVSMKNVDTCVDVTEYDDDGMIVLHQQHPPSQYSLMTQQYNDEYMLKYQSPNVHIQVLDEVVNEALGEAQVSLDKHQTCLIPPFSVCDDQKRHNIPSNVSQRKAFSHTLSTNIDAIASTDIDTHIDTYINTYINTYNATDEEKDHTKEVEYLGSYSTAINTMQFLLSAKEFIIGCVYMNKLQPKSYAQHESIKNMVEGTLRDLRLDSNTQEKTLIAFSFRCISKLITGLRNPKKKIDDPDTETPIVSVEDTLLFAFLVEVSPQLLFKISAHFIATENPIRFGDWFALTSIGIVAHCTLPSDGLPIATISLIVEGKIPNGGPVLATTISGSLEGVQILCELEIQINRWIQPFAINWLFLNVTMSGSLVVSPVVVLDTVKFAGQFYVIPRDLQAIIKTMDVEEAFARILTDPFFLEATLIADLRSSRFHFKARVVGLSLSRILSDIFLQDVGNGFPEVIIVDIEESENTKNPDSTGNLTSSVECDYQIGSVTNLNLQGEIYLQVGEFKLFLKAGYKANNIDNTIGIDTNLILNFNSNLLTAPKEKFEENHNTNRNTNHDIDLDLEFKAVGVMSKLSILENKVIIQSYGSATPPPLFWEKEILDFIPAHIKDEGDYKDGALFALVLNPKENYFLFQGAITVCSLVAGFSGIITKDGFRLRGKLDINKVIVLDLDVKFDFSNFVFHSELSYSFDFTTPEVKIGRVIFFEKKTIKIDLTGTLEVHISAKKSFIKGFAKFKVEVKDSISEVSFKFHIEMNSLEDLPGLIQTHIFRNFAQMVFSTLKRTGIGTAIGIFTAVGAALVVLYFKNYLAVGTVSYCISQGVPYVLLPQIDNGTAPDPGSPDPLHSRTSGAHSEPHEFTNFGDNRLSNGKLYKSQKLGYSVYSLLGLQNDPTPINEANVITDEIIKNVKGYLSKTFTPKALVGASELFKFNDNLFDTSNMSTAAIEQTTKLCFDCIVIATTAGKLISLLGENNVTSIQAQGTQKKYIRATPRNNIIKIVNLLPAYYLDLKKISEVLLHQWFISDNVVLPPLFQHFVPKDPSKTLPQLISSAIMQPFILHLEFFSILLHNLDAVLGLISSSEDKKVFDGKVLNIYCMIVAQALIARHYNTALLYPNIHANGTLIKVNGVNCVILDSRLYKIPSFIKSSEKEVTIASEVSIHEFQKAIRHSSLMSPALSTLVSSTSDIAQLRCVDEGGIRKYAISIHRHLRYISQELLAIVRDDAKTDAILVDKIEYAPGLPLYRNTSFLKGFARGLKNRRMVHSEVNQIVWSSVDYEYGAISLNTFLYPAIITVTDKDYQDTTLKIFRLTPDFIFRIDSNVPLQNITKLYQECYILTESQTAYHLTLPIEDLPSILCEDIIRIVDTYKSTVKVGADLKTYIKNLPTLKLDSKFKVVQYKSIPDSEKQFQLVFGTDNDYFQTQFLTRRPRSIQTEEAYKKLKNKPISPNQTISILSIDEQPSNYDADGNYKYEMKEGVYAIDDWDTIVTVPAFVTTITAGSFRNSNIKQVIFEAGSALRTIEEYAFSGCVDLKSITIPASVSYISDTAFIDSGLLEMNFEPGTQLKSIFIPASVTTIGGTTTTAGAFQGSELKSIQFEEMSKLTTIAENTFCECQALDSIIIPASVTIIGNQAFKRSGLEDITFEEGTKITEIKAHAFHGCESLDSITIPATVVTIADSAFTNSRLLIMKFVPGTSLQSIQIPRSVTTISSTTIDKGAFESSALEKCTFEDGSTLEVIETNTFYKCLNLSSIKIPRSVISINNNAFGYSALNTITFEDASKLESIKSHAFNECKYLKSIVIPTSVITIEDDAFINSALITMKFLPGTQIESVGIPASVTTIEENAFKGSNLKSITFASKSKLNKIGKEAFFECEKLVTIDIPHLVTMIAESTFRGSGIKNIKFVTPINLNTIHNYAFYGCKDLVSIEIPKSVKILGIEVFRESGITKVTFEPSSVLSRIPEKTFYQCVKLDSVDLPPSVRTLDKESFAESSLSKLACPGLYIVGSLAFSRCPNLKSFTMMPTMNSAISERAFESSGLENLDFNFAWDTMARCDIGTRAFYDCKSLITANLDYGVTSIGVEAFAESSIAEIAISSPYIIRDRAFYKCMNLASIEIPKSVKTLGIEVFRESGITKVTFKPTSELTSIPARTFYKCMKLDSVDLPSSVRSLSTQAFAESSISKLTYPGLYTVGSLAFAKCPNLKSFTMTPSMHTAISERAFESSGLENLDFKSSWDGFTSCDIGTRAFYDCKSLTTANLGYGITSIGVEAFAESSIAEIAISNPYIIRDKAFYKCMNLASIEIPKSVETLGIEVFRESGITKVTFKPTSQLKEIPTRTFYKCMKLTSIDLPPSVVTIWTQAFAESSLSGITCPGVINVGPSTFAKCLSLKSFTMPMVRGGIVNDKAFESSGLETVYFNDCPSYLMPGPLFLNDQVFYNCKSLQTARMGNTTSLRGSEIFAESGIAEITFSGSSLSTIPAKTFYKCMNLASIEIPASVKTLGTEVFRESGITNVTFKPTSELTSIPARTFYKCMKLDSVDLPSSVRSLSTQAFAESSISKLTYPGLYTVGSLAFAKCPNLKSFTMTPSMHTAISERAFESSGLENLDFKSSWDGFTSCDIGTRAFYDCKSLTTANLGYGITSIGVEAFAESSIAEIAISNPYIIRDKAFYKCMNLASIEIPKSVETLGIEVFRESGITKVTFKPTSQLKEIPTRTFYKCMKLTSIDLPPSVVTIWTQAFAESSLSGITCPGVINVGPSTFAKCLSLKSFTMPMVRGGIVNDKAFESSGLETVYFNDCPSYLMPGPLFLNDQVFYNCKSLQTARMGNTTSLRGSEIFAESGIAEITFSGSSLSTIPAKTFYKCMNLASIEIPASVKTLGTEVFRESGITKVTFKPTSELEYIPTRAFYKCLKLISVDLPSSVRSLDTQAFAESSLSKFTCPELYTVGSSAFAKCPNLKSFTMSGFLLSSIKESAFESSGLENIYFLNDVGGFSSTIENRAFYGCKSLQSVKIPTTVSSVGVEAFAESGIREVTFYKLSSSNILDRAFYKCMNLVSIELPKNLKTLGTEVFRESGLTTVTFRPSPELKLIPAKTFYKCSDLLNFDTPASISEIKESVFGLCKDLHFTLLSRSSKIKINRSAFEGVDNPPSDPKINWVD